MDFINQKFILRSIGGNSFKEVLAINEPITKVASNDTTLILATQHKILLYAKKNIKKIAESSKLITSIFTERDLIYVGYSNGEIDVFSYDRTRIAHFSSTGGNISSIAVYNRVVFKAAAFKLFVLNLSDESSSLIHEFNAEIHKIAVYNAKLHVLTSNSFISMEIVEEGSSITLKQIGIAENEHDATNFAFNEDFQIFVSGAKMIKRHLGGILEKILHFREITSFFIHRKFIYTSSIDGHVKSFNSDMKSNSIFGFSEPVMSVQIIDNNLTVVTISGRILQYAQEQQKMIVEPVKIKKLNAYDDELIVHELKVRRMAKNDIDRHLNRFEYKMAFKKAFKGQDLNEVYYVLRLLQTKRLLKRLIIDQTENFLIDFLSFILTNFAIFEFQEIFMESLIIVLSMYAEEILCNEVLSNLIVLIAESIDDHVQFYGNMLETMSFLESFE